MNCSSNDKSSSSESSSLSYVPRNDVPGAIAAAFSLNFSFSFGWCLGLPADERVVRSFEDDAKPSIPDEGESRLYEMGLLELRVRRREVMELDDAGLPSPEAWVSAWEDRTR